MIVKTNKLSQDLCNLIFEKHATRMGYRTVSRPRKVPVNTVGANPEVEVGMGRDAIMAPVLT